jgi:hypothetical protein
VLIIRMRSMTIYQHSVLMICEDDKVLHTMFSYTDEINGLMVE